MTRSKQVRHFKALSKKNWINWKRTLFGSIVELVCPIFLMSMLMMLRLQISVEYIKDIDLAKLRHGLYPATKFNLKTEKYEISLDSIES
jgi:hypothetical protein